MPVQTETSISGPYFPNGVTTDFGFDFKAASVGEVVAVDGEGNVIPTALYSVSVDDDEGGSLSFDTAPEAAEYPTIYVVSDPALTQPSDFDNAGPSFNPAALTRSLDRAAIRDLKLKQEIDRGLRVPFGEQGVVMPSSASRAGKYFKWDGAGLPSLDTPENFAAPAAAAAERAENARDVAVYNGPYFDSVALGEVATTTGQEFAVIENGDLTFYRRTPGGSTKLWSPADGIGYKVLYPIVGEANFIPRLQAALATYTTVLCLGNFPVASVYGSILTGKHIRGIIGLTKFTVDAGLTTGDIFDLGVGSSITGVEIAGPMAAPDPTSASWFNTINDALARSGAGALNLVRLRGVSAQIDDCTLTGSPGNAVLTSKNNVGAAGTAVTSGVFNCRIFGNYCGIQIPEESEYLSFPDNWICWNVIGIDKAGGNNIFDNDHTDHNRVNFISRQGLNNSHGSYTGGTLNHAKFAAVICDRLTNGEVFSGVNIFDGGPRGFYSRQCNGVNVSGCLVGRLAFYCEGVGTVGSALGTNIVHGNIFNLNSLGTASTNKVYRNFNYATGLSDPTTPDNFVFRNNNHMEGDSRRDTTNWDPMWINDYLFPDSNGWRYGETVAGTQASRFAAGTPVDGVKHLGASASTGAIAIELPVPNFNSSLVTFDIEISSSIAGRSSRIEFTAYAITSSGGSWASPTWVRVDGYNYKIRLGRTAAGRPVVYIGDLATSFTNTLVRVHNITVHTGAYALARYWQTRWTIRQEASAFENVTAESPDASGSDAPLDYSGSLNVIATTSVVYAISAANRPGSENGFCETIVRQAGSSIRKQVYTSIASAAVHVRYTSTGDAGWSVWTAL